MSNGAEDMEEQIRREMEQEIARNHQSHPTLEARLPNAENTVKPTSIADNAEHAEINAQESNEEDLIKAEIEARLLRKKQQREERVKREAEEKARREAEEQAKREAEEKARREAEEQARREAEEQARREAEEQARREAKEKARREAEEQAKREAREQARREAEEQAKRKAEEQARREAEEQAKREAEEQARREAEEQARREAEEQAKREAKEQAKREAEEQARREAKEQARREAKEKARRQAEEQARREAEEQARREAIEKAKREAEEQARREAEEQARREAKEKARREAEEQARREAEEQARREAAEREAKWLEEERQRQAAHEAELEDIRRQAREAVFREFAEKSKHTTERAAERARKRASLSGSIHTPTTASTQVTGTNNENENKLNAIEHAVKTQLSEQDTSLQKNDIDFNLQNDNNDDYEHDNDQRNMHFRSASSSSSENSSSIAEDKPSHGYRTLSNNNVAKSKKRQDDEYDSDSKSLTSSDDESNDESDVNNNNVEQSNVLSENNSNNQLTDQALGAYRNDNGILCRYTISQLNLFDDSRQPAPAHHKPELASFEQTLQSELHELGLSVEEGKRNRIEVHRYGTIREPGRCLFPPNEMSTNIPAHTKIQLGFFSAKQTIMALQKVTQYYITDRERVCEGNERSLSTLTCYFESEVLENPMLTVDDEAFPHNAPSEQLYTKADILRGGEHAICKAVSSISYGDPIQVWERVQSGSSNEQESFMPRNSHAISDNMSTTVTHDESNDSTSHSAKKGALTIKVNSENVVNNNSSTNVNKNNKNNNNKSIKNDNISSGKAVNASFTIATKARNSTAHDLWVSGLETKKPIPAMRTFTGGKVFYVEAAKLRSAVTREHGEGIDPFFLSVAFYSITENHRSKVSDTFYFDSGLDIFYPHKERSNLAKVNKVITFIPNEFLGTLYIIVRVYRPCSEEFDSYVDLYTRPERYKPVHFAPMKQETLLLAQASDVCEELGWTCARVDREKSLKNLIMISELYRKPMRDKEVLKLAEDKRSRNALKTIPFQINIELHDVTKYEVAFPTSGPDPQPVENETLVSLLNPDVPGARAQTYRYAPCCIPILNSGYFTTYTNVYYLRLAEMHVNITGTLRSVPNTHRTFAIQVCMKDRDDNLSDDGALRCIYGRGLNCLALDTHAWSSSVNGSTEFSLSDEIKFELPLHLTDKHHLFFTLYAMYMKRSAPIEGTPRAIKVGFAILPVMVDGVVHVRDHIELKFIANDHAAKASAGGYLSHFPKAPISAHINGGEPVLLANTQTRTSVHASNKIIASVFRNCGASLAEIKRNDDVLVRSGQLVNIPVPKAGVADPHYGVIKLISELPLAEILAFYPFLSAYALALIGSPSASVSLASRMHMLDTLLLITSKSQTFDTNRHTVQRRHGSAEPSAIFAKSSAASVLYHFLTNNVLYEDDTRDNNNNNNNENNTSARAQATEFRLYAGVAETWLQMLNALAPQTSAAATTTSTSSSLSSSVKNNSLAAESKNAKSASSTKNATDGSVNNNKNSFATPKSVTLKLGANNSFFYVNENGSASANRNASRGNASKAAVATFTSSDGVTTPIITSAANPNARNIEREMSDLSWLLFDTILRSIYIWCEDHPHDSRIDRFDVSFYGTLVELCVRVLERLSVYDESILVKRIAIFVRNLMLYCDRGQVLTIYERIIAHFEEQNNYESLTNFFKYVLDDNDVVFMLLPSANTSEAVFLTELLIRAFSALLVHQSRSIRTIACQVMYNFLRRLANDPLVSSTALTRIATQLFSLVRNMGLAWQSLTNAQVSDKVPMQVVMHEQRQLAMIALWILYYTPASHLVQWMRHEEDTNALSGVMRIVSDAQAYFRYSAGVNKRRHDMLQSSEADQDDDGDEVNSLVKEWDARHATFVTAIGTRLCSLFLHSITSTLRMVKVNERSGCVFPFFLLLESVLKLGNSTISLQMSSALIHEAVGQLFPEIMSRKAKMSSGMVLLTFQLMSSCCQYVRTTAGWTFLLMSQSFYAWTHSLSKIKSLTANALVTVAESRTRDLRLAGRFIEFQLDDLIEEAKIEEVDFIRPSANYDTRYEDDTNAPGGDALMRYKYNVHDAYMSVQTILPWPAYLRDKQNKKNKDNKELTGESDAESNLLQSKGNNSNSNNNTRGNDTNSANNEVKKFSDEFTSMAATVLSLFNDVLQLKVDDSMKFKEAKIFAYFEVFRNFLQQNALREALKWLYRLHEAHIANHDYVEASMVLVFIAALCFRVTEVYYSMKGTDSRGARMPHGVFTKVFWHDYVRVLPEVDQLLPLDAVFAIVNELYICPEDACFTIEGQIKTLKEAAEHADKAQYYVFSLDIIHLVDTYLQIINDYKGCAVAHNAMHSWATAIANGVEQKNNKYYFMWARMEREEESNSRVHSSAAVSANSPSALMSLSTSYANSSNDNNNKNVLADTDNMVGEKPHGLVHGKPIRRIYKMPPSFTTDEFRDYATAYLTLLFSDPTLIEVTEALTETLPALPEPDSKRKRAAAIHRPPNHCILTVCEVQPYFPKGQPIPPDGFDKTMHINHFVNVQHAWLSEKGYSPRHFNVMQQCMTISTYELDRAFPSTTSAIDIAEIHKVDLNPYETAEEVISNRRDEVRHLARSKDLIVALKDALMVRGLQPGVYMKEVIRTMSDHSSIMTVLKELCTLVRARMAEADEMNAMLTYPEDYALVLKAITDVECCLIAATPEQPASQQREGKY